MKTDGLIKLIKSLSDIVVKSCVVGENGCAILADDDGAVLIKFC